MSHSKVTVTPKENASKGAINLSEQMNSKFESYSNEFDEGQKRSKEWMIISSVFVFSLLAISFKYSSIIVLVPLSIIVGQMIMDAVGRKATRALGKMDGFIDLLKIVKEARD